jgi:hypothetical protein
MRVAIVFVALISCALATTLQVTLNLQGGMPDPQWTVVGETADKVLALLPKEPREVQRPIPWYRMGYRGFEVVTDEGAVFEIYDNPLAETALLSGVSYLSSEVSSHVKSEVKRVAMLSADEKAAVPFPGEAPLACNPPVRGSDNNTVYSPQTDCDGCFVSHVSENNCYNYGNDVATNTFAQPGRGTGQKWKTNTCADMRDAAIRDGLSWQGTTLPTANPKVGHYLALLIWPNTNFHWIRFDSVPAGKWSHKAGGTPVKNVDNRGLPITDPSKSDFAPWTQFCGYMIGVPSNVTIN